MNYVHGGDVYRRAVDLDYSVNINPLGMPPRACQAAKHGVDQSTAYPDWKVEKLRDAVVSFLNRKFAAVASSAGTNADICVPSDGMRADATAAVAPEWISFGNGAADLIYRLMQVLRPQQVVVAAPAFAEYSVAAERVGAQVVPVYLSEADDFSFTPAVEAAFIQAIERAPSGSAVFLCNPNNPDGNVIRAEVLQRIAAVCEAHHSWLLVDECFLPFLRSEIHYSMVPSLRAFEHLVILRAFTKIYGMPGLRLGYMLTAAQALTDAVRATMTPWEINLPAQLAGVAALEETKFVEKTRALIRAERAFLVQTLPTLPYVEKVYVPVSDANFILFRTALTQPDCPEGRVRNSELKLESDPCVSENRTVYTSHSVDLKSLLLDRGVLIRACGNYEGLDARYYRICVRTHEENLALIQRWRAL